MAKLRVYELAKELGVDSEQVLATLAAMGEFIRSASSPLEPAMVRAVRERLSPQPDGEEIRSPERYLARDLDPIIVRPFLLETHFRKKQHRTVAIKDLAPLEQVIARYRTDKDRISEGTLESIRAEARSWANEWLSDKDAAQWLPLHLDPENVRQCRNLGITPELIKLPFRMPGRALAGGRLTYLAAFYRDLVSIQEIHDDLVRTGHLPPAH